MRKGAANRMWLPQYWLTWLWVGIMWTMAQLPRSVRDRMGRGLGLLLYWFARSRSHVVKVNMRLCFPDKSPTEQQAMVRQCCIEHGVGIADMALSWFGSPKRWPQLRMQNVHLLDAAAARGCGLLLIGAHYTSIDMCSTLFAQAYPLSAVYRPLKNPVMHWCMERAMRRFEKAIHRDDVRTLIRTLKSGGMVWYAPDQDYGRRHSVFAPLFGVAAATVTATGRIAQLSRCAVLTASNYRVEGGDIELTFGELSPEWPTGDDIVDCTAVNQAIERGIMVEPTQYMWTHRRFKTRPEGEPRPY